MTPILNTFRFGQISKDMEINFSNGGPPKEYFPVQEYKEILSEIAKLGIQSIYVEGGPSIHDQFLASGYWDEVITYISPILLGGNNTSSFTSNRITSEKIQLNNTKITKLGEDIRISGRRVSQCLQD